MEMPGYRFPKSKFIWRDLVGDVGEIGDVFLRRTRTCFYFFLSILLWLVRSLGGACSVVIFLDIIFTRFTVPQPISGWVSLRPMLGAVELENVLPCIAGSVRHRFVPGSRCIPAQGSPAPAITRSYMQWEDGRVLPLGCFVLLTVVCRPSPESLTLEKEGGRR
jgi:hypothetical protein